MLSGSEKTRVHILETTLELLNAEHQHRPRLSDIADAAGITRQGLYLYFPNWALLLRAVDTHVGDRTKIDCLLTECLDGNDGERSLTAFISVWGNHIPNIHGLERTFVALSDTEPDVRIAWQVKMMAIKHYCASTVAAMQRDGVLRPGLSEGKASDLLFALISVGNWQTLTRICGWSQADYLQEITRMARIALIDTRSHR